MSRSSLRPARRNLLLVALVLSAAGALVPVPSAAAVQHGLGYQARVDGDPGWFGSFRLDGIGLVWCVDAELPAPDAAARYRPAALNLSSTTRTALAWLLGTHGFGTSRIDHAAIALATHHLVGARYPSGPLNVHRLTPAAMVGFGADATAVATRACAFLDDALAHRFLRAPLRLAVVTPGVAAGADGHATATVTDVTGVPVAGVPVLFGITGATATGARTGVTDGAGRVRLGFRAGAEPVRVQAVAAAPDLALQAFAPTTERRQRVVRAAQVALAATATATPVPPPATVTVRKTGDAQPFLGVGGARFEVRPVSGTGLGPVAGTLVTDATGASETLRLVPGRYRVTEVAAPPGYRVAGPWTVDLAPGEAGVVRAHDQAVRARATIAKVDATTGAYVAGAHLIVAHDADLDGSYETALPGVVTSDRPTERLGLLPGRYRVMEVRAPDGYVLDDTPIDVELQPGEVGTVVVENRPAPVELTGTKVDAVTGTALPGAVYDLYRRLADPPPSGHEGAGEDGQPVPPADAAPVPGHVWVARATSAADGTLRWPGVRPGAVHCAREVRPPVGYRSDPTLRCTDRPVAVGALPVLRLPDEPLPPPPSTTSTTTEPPTPPPTTPSTTAPPPPATPPTAAPPNAPPRTPALARTGAPVTGLALVGGGLVALGVASATTPRRRRG